MDNDKFQELVISHFREVQDQLKAISDKLVQHDHRFDRLDEETEKIAVQVEKLVAEQDDFTNYLLKRRMSR